MAISQYLSKIGQTKMNCKTCGTDLKIKNGFISYNGDCQGCIETLKSKEFMDYFQLEQVEKFKEQYMSNNDNKHNYDRPDYNVFNSQQY
jgi:hypothetical protein